METEERGMKAVLNGIVSMTITEKNRLITDGILPVEDDDISNNLLDDLLNEDIDLRELAAEPLPELLW